jgi:hypothetical protein
MKKLIALMVFLMIPLAQAKNDPKVSLEALKSTLKKMGAAATGDKAKVGDVEVPDLKFGNKSVVGNFMVVDSIKKSHGGTATLFVKNGEEYIRVSTNVLKDDGTRAIGTPLAKNKAYEAVQKGETFCGEVEILGKPFNTCYEPIKDDKNQTLGIYYVGYPK